MENSPVMLLNLDDSGGSFGETNNIQSIDEDNLDTLFMECDEEIQEQQEDSFYMECQEEPLSISQLGQKRRLNEAFNDMINTLEKAVANGSKITRFSSTNDENLDSASFKVDKPSANPSKEIRINLPQNPVPIQETPAPRIINVSNVNRGSNVFMNLNGRLVPLNTIRSNLPATNPTFNQPRQIPTTLPQIAPINTIRPGLNLVPIPKDKILNSGVPNNAMPTNIRVASNTNPVVLSNNSVINNKNQQPQKPAVQNEKPNPSKPKSSTQFHCLNIHPKPLRAIKDTKVKQSELDNKVKKLLMFTPKKFTEWLFQQNLIPHVQHEIHGNKKIQMKLALSTDKKKHVRSGGYSWVSETTSQRTLSVFANSIFEKSDSIQAVIKLLYHWSCQTNVQNVAHWVKVDQKVIDYYYQIFRSLCMMTIEKEIKLLGGFSKVVEVGIISLGIPSKIGGAKEVFVEIIGIFDRSTTRFRMRANKPSKAVLSQSEKYHELLSYALLWIHRESHIIINTFLDRSLFANMGFRSVAHSQSQTESKSNFKVMNYLKKVMPKMFEEHLAGLNINQIQQFLDELTFRELFGHYPLMCFDSMLDHIGAMVKASIQTGTSILKRCSNITQNNETSQQTTPAIKQPVFSVPNIPLPNSVQITPSSSNNEVYVSLQDYFYGSLDGNKKIQDNEFKADMAFKCHACKKNFLQNTEFMKHLSFHVDSDRSYSMDFADIKRCKYCFKEFTTDIALEEHIEESHLLKDSKIHCRICLKVFTNNSFLSNHMKLCHVKYDLPYQCQACGYRSSFHHDVIDHFEEYHDRSDKIQCPYCLKVFSLFGDKGYNANISFFFLAHLQSHHTSLDVKNLQCTKCVCTFLSIKEKKAHLEKDHVSFMSIKEVKPFLLENSFDWGLKTPKPVENFELATVKNLSIKSSLQLAFAAKNFEDMVMYDAEDRECSECGTKLVKQHHFSAFQCCTKCQFSTCCSKSMKAHHSIFHSNSNVKFNLGKPSILANPMYCCCGYSTNSGNKMAKHLASNSCQTAYPSKFEAKEAVLNFNLASFAPLVSIENDEEEIFDPNEVMAKAYYKNTNSTNKPDENREAEEGPLGFLGLQRKSTSDS